MDNKINTNYEKFYTFSERYIPPEYEVNALNVDIKNTPSIFTNLSDLVENLPEAHVPELYIYEVDHVEIDNMMPVKHGICIKSKRFKISSIVNLFAQDSEIIKKLPNWLVLKRLQSDPSEFKDQNDILLAYATDKNRYCSIRCGAINALPFSAFDTDTLINLLSDRDNDIRDTLARKTSETEFFPDWVYKILMNDKSTSIAFAANMRLSEKHPQDI